MAERHPGWVTGINDFEARLAQGALVTAHPSTDQLDPLRARSGLRDAPGTPGRLVLGTNQVTVQPFQAVIQDPARPALGAYVATLDAPKDLPLTAADPSRDRTDLVIAEIIDDDPGFVVRVVEGERSAGGTAQPPGVPNPLHLKLGQIFLPAGGSPTYTDLRQFTAALGGILPVRGAADMPTPAGGPLSQFVFRLDTGQLMVRNSAGSQWIAYRPPRGSVDTWNTPVFASGWRNYGRGFAPAGYTITEDGWVRLRGLIQTDVARAPNTTIFTLPTGYRPRHQHLWTTPSSNGPVRLDVTQGGAVVLGAGLDISSPSGKPPVLVLTRGLDANDWVAIDCVAFAALGTYAG